MIFSKRLRQEMDIFNYIHSSYKDEKFLKRIMITNVKRVSKGKKIDLSKLYSDGSYYTYEIDKEKKNSNKKISFTSF